MSTSCWDQMPVYGRVTIPIPGQSNAKKYSESEVSWPHQEHNTMSLTRLKGTLDSDFKAHIYNYCSNITLRNKLF